MANRLGCEKSPYLLQHKDNPVDWYPWGEEAFRAAEREDKPIFLSIGYSTCHWCHVMAHESFEDGEVAALLNRSFISIKVDREERPDVDAVYMSACQTMTGSGGWPLTVLMTPDQKPFFAGTYFPKRSAWGQIGLIQLLERAALLWQQDRAKLLNTGEQLTQALQLQTLSNREPDPDLADRACDQLRQLFDPKWGGFGAAPKFPTPHNLLFLMEYARVTGRPEGLEMAAFTLDAMARGGIHDHIGGGFSRYSTDGMWLVPHFEKMLYDNALLLLAYVTAYRHTGQERYADTAHRTARYILRELTGPKGGCYCGQDADSDGVEGKYYVFTPEEAACVLGEADGAEFCRLYDITAAGNFEGKSIPNRIANAQPGWDREDGRLKALYRYRLDRTHLHKDDKVLLAWNGWAMLALAQAGFILKERTYLDAALGIHHFIQGNMTDGNDRLYLRWREGEAAHAGQLEDYAVYALALLELYRVTLDPEYLRQAIRRAEQMTDLFEDRENGGYFMTAADGEALIARPKQTYDGAIPSGNSVAALVLQRLAALTGETEWLDRARRQQQFLAGAMGEYPSASCLGALAVLEGQRPHRELVCATAQDLPGELEQFLRTPDADGLHILLKTAQNAGALAACAPFTQNYPIPEQGAVYYLCQNGVCRAPVTEFDQLGLGKV